ncbi:hypothetical protein [Spirosoma aerolatum]|uniref:hypothetical protein n=1 Tax=Spirosoma aerolatum TaxID=1211326 RepID=UPI0012D2E08E|nr:hypothetical protein [Spirosoma aerolatum]
MTRATGKLLYACLYGKGPSVGGGNLRVTDFDDKTWIYGTFIVQPAGRFDMAQSSNLLGTVDIRDVFRVRRTH